MNLEEALEKKYTREAIFEANALVQVYFEASLREEVGKSALEHLTRSRRLPDWLIKEEGLGYFPQGANRIVAFSRQRGIPLELCAEAGLIKRSEARIKRAFQTAKGRPPQDMAELAAYFREVLAEKDEFYYDFPVLVTPAGEYRHGDWLTIPIRVLGDDGSLQIAGFQYRSMRPQREIGKGGRYRSPRASAAMSWPDTLFGLAEEGEQIARSGWAVICEGKFDQAAVKGAVRSLPADQRPGVLALGGVSTRGRSEGGDPWSRAGILGKIGAGRITLFLDADEPGENAVLNLGPLLMELGVTVDVAMVEDGIAMASSVAEPPGDPGELGTRLGPAALLMAINAAAHRDIPSYAAALLEKRLSVMNHSGQVWRRLTGLDKVVDVLSVLGPDRQEYGVKKIAEALGLSEGTVLSSVRTIPDKERESRGSVSRSVLASPRA